MGCADLALAVEHALDVRQLVCRAAQALKGNAPAADEAVLAERFGTMVAQA